MSNTPHQLAADFPDLADKISALKAADPHFAHLMQDYDVVNDEVHLAETDVKPMEDLALTELRKKRMLLKDEIYKALTATA
ncbi:YdcH family protein [Celeribacter sp. PS-C1]|uniref:YdcH family protein n=1 Tax=Celeribacter sp. PS-C1 TaxID=2820813 RepID=UPI001CA4DA4D|nr:DUF465 domain-containing protein [Celeribacter sp. PS-C1]MBW6416669.1 DUF465 domain-containing protein [Celeribacter sp. PS-C1]